MFWERDWLESLNRGKKEEKKKMVYKRQSGGNIFKQILSVGLGGGLSKMARGKARGATSGALRGAMEAMPRRRVKDLTRSYSKAALDGALLTLADTLRKGRRVPMQRGKGKFREKSKRLISKVKRKAVYYKPTNIVRRGAKSLVNAALDGVFDSALDRVLAMQSQRQSGGSLFGVVKRGIARSGPARGISGAASFSRKHRAKINKGLSMLESLGAYIDRNQRGGGVEEGVIAKDKWVFKTVHPGMSVGSLQGALNRLATRDRLIAIEMLKRGHSY